MVHKVYQVHKVHQAINGLVNQTEFKCVACLLDALAKLETGAVTIDVNITIPEVFS